MAGKSPNTARNGGRPRPPTSREELRRLADEVEANKPLPQPPTEDDLVEILRRRPGRQQRDLHGDEGLLAIANRRAQENLKLAQPVGGLFGFWGSVAATLTSYVEAGTYAAAIGHQRVFPSDQTILRAIFGSPPSNLPQAIDYFSRIYEPVRNDPRTLRFADGLVDDYMALASQHSQIVRAFGGSFEPSRPAAFETLRDLAHNIRVYDAAVDYMTWLRPFTLVQALQAGGWEQPDAPISFDQRPFGPGTFKGFATGVPNRGLVQARQIGGLGTRGFQHGGRPRPGSPVVVGERGREIFVPDRPGRVLPNDQLGSGEDGQNTDNLKQGQSAQSRQMERARLRQMTEGAVASALGKDLATGGRFSRTFQRTYGVSRAGVSR